MERYENGDEDVPWQPSDTTASDVAAESREERERYADPVFVLVYVLIIPPASARDD
jgi:hypothetical protein